LQPESLSKGCKALATKYRMEALLLSVGQQMFSDIEMKTAKLGTLKMLRL